MRKIITLCILIISLFTTSCFKVEAKTYTVNKRSYTIKVKGNKRKFKCKVIVPERISPIANSVTIKLPSKGNYAVTISRCKPSDEIVSSLWSLPVEVTTNRHFKIVEGRVFSKKLKKTLKRHKYKKSFYNKSTFKFEAVTDTIVLQIPKAEYYTDVYSKYKSNRDIISTAGTYFYAKGTTAIPMEFTVTVKRL